MIKQHSIVCIHEIFFIQLPGDGLLGCFHILAIVNIAAMKIRCMYLFKLVFSQIYTQECKY